MDHILIFLLIFAFLSTARCQQSKNVNPCKYFQDILKKIPNEKLTSREGVYKSINDGKKYNGCKVKFVTEDSLLTGNHLPSFRAVEGTVLYQKGWRSNINYQADGPGTTAYGIEKADTLCLISERQPATLIEPGKIERSSILTIVVECRIK